MLPGDPLGHVDCAPSAGGRLLAHMEGANPTLLGILWVKDGKESILGAGYSTSYVHRW